MAGQFAFPVDENSKAGAVRLIRGDTDFVVPVADLSGAAALLTATALGASASYTQTAQDRLGEILVGAVRGFAFADQAGTLLVEESEDGASWTTLATVTVAANTLVDTGWVALSKRKYRFKYDNGATAQTAFVLYQAIAPAGIIEEVAGWKWAKVIAAGAGDQTVKATAGKVAKLYVETGANVYIKDGANQAWRLVAGGGGEDFAGAPLACGTSIILNFSAAGTAWILYR